MFQRGIITFGEFYEKPPKEQKMMLLSMQYKIEQENEEKQALKKLQDQLKK